MLFQDLIELTLLFAGTVALAACLMYTYRRIALLRRCPICGDSDVEREPRKGWLRNLSFVKSYTCQECGTSFVRLSRNRSASRRRLKRQTVDA